MDAVPPLADLLDPARYRLVRELGRGGMGVVYLAHNLPMDRPEVLKVVARAGAADRFATEIRAAARLAHPNVVAAFSTFRAGPLAVLAMEYVEGQDLGRVVDEAGPLPVPTAVGYVLQAAAALQHAHDRGMTHRDVKPSNLMLTPDGTVKVLDFGLAKLARDGGSGTDPSARGRLLGTAGFMAPEQIRDPASADGRADVYSLGCTLYYLLAGGPPFPGHSLLAILAAHQAAPPPPLPDLPPGLWPVIAKMLAKAPADRFPSPAAAAEALAPFAAKERMGERPGLSRLGFVGGKTAGPSPAARRGVVLAAVAVVVVAAAVAVVARPRPAAVAADPPAAEPVPAAAPEPPTVTPPPAPPAPKLAFYYGGTWGVSDGLLHQADPANHFSILGLPASVGWTDYDYTVEAQRYAGRGQFALWFRTTPQVAGYLFIVGGTGDVTQIERQRLKNHPRGQGFDVLAKTTRAVADGVWYTALVRVRGPHIECFLDDELVIELDDDEIPTGGIGLRTVYSAYRFRNLRATAPDGTVLWDGPPDRIELFK